LNGKQSVTTLNRMLPTDLDRSRIVHLVRIDCGAALLRDLDANLAELFGDSAAAAVAAKSK
jgi:hypothetical protein